MTTDPRLAPVHDWLRRLDLAGEAVARADTRYRAALDQRRTGPAVIRASLALTEARRDLTTAAIEAHRSGALDTAAQIVARARLRQPDSSRQVDVDDEVQA